MLKPSSRHRAALLLAASFIAPPVLAAQTVASSPDIIVTGQKREATLQDSDASITVLDAKTIDEARIRDFSQIDDLVPNVQFNQGGQLSNVFITIRGVESNPFIVNRAAVYVDGVPFRELTNAILTQVESIEVMRGPQGTLYGANSESGLLVIKTRLPSDRSEAELRATGSRFSGTGGFDLEGYYSQPIVADRLAASIAVKYSDESSWMRNRTPGVSQPGKIRQAFVHTKLRWTPSTDTTVNFGAYLLDIAAPGVFDNDFFPQDRDRYDANYSRYNGDQRSGRYGYFHDAPARTDENEYVLGLSAMQKVGEGAIDAALYIGSRRSFDTRETFDEFFPDSPYNADISLLFRNRAFGLFGEATYPLAERLKLTAGLRQSWECKRYAAQWRAASTNASPLRAASDRQTISDDYLTGRAALSWEAGTGLNLYGVAAFGHKAGGFNEFPTDIAQGLPDAPYGRAKVRSLELGFKYRDPSAGLDLSGAVFDNRNRGDHLLVFDSLSFATRAENFDTHSRGVELDAAWRPTQHLSLSGGLNYTDAEITGVPAASQAGVVRGNRVPDSPEWSAAASIEHRLPLGQFGAIGEAQVVTLVSYRYTGKRAADPQNNFDLPEYHKLDARIALKVGRYEVYAWADNLLDETYDLFGYYYAPFFPGGPDATFGAPGRGRTLGVGLRADF